jgi:glycerophosphoryl diester phosphodiesterase
VAGRTLNIAHRGASAVAPGNTLAAFEKAVELGADGVEFDVQLSSDGVPVVIHDFTVDRTTDGTGRVAEMPLAQLKELDAGTAFSPTFAGQKVPTLTEVLDAIGGQLLLNIELKSISPWDPRLEDAVVAQVRRHRLGERVLFSSFNPLSLRRAKRLEPRIPVGIIYGPGLPLPFRRAWLAPIVVHEARHPKHSLVDAGYMAWAKRRGYQVNAWTVNDAETMHRLIALGADGIITDVPDVLGMTLGAAPNPVQLSGLGGDGSRARPTQGRPS